MKIKQKNYPYPVLNFFNKISEEINFSCTLDLEEIPELDIVRFKVSYVLNNEILKTLIEQKKAIFALHLECPSTMKRVLLKTNSYEDEFEVPLKDLNKSVDVNFFILSNEDIKNYKNVEVDPYSEGLSFDLSKGDILAIGLPETFDIEKEPLVETNSIFELVPTDKSDAKPIEVDLSADKIRIHLPKKDFELMNQIHSETFYRADSLLVAIYYTPAIVEALYMVKNMYDERDEDQIDIIRDNIWYRSLKARLYHINLNIEELPSNNLLGIAHQMLDNPNKKAMDYFLNVISEEDI